MKPPKEVETPVSSFREKLGNRIRELEKWFKNRAAAAEVAGVAKSTLQNWVEGKADPSFEGLARLSEATGKSLDWLATGEEREREPIDEALLSMVIEELERFREERGLYWNPERRARLISLGYAMMLAEREKGQESNVDALRYMLEAAS